MGSLRAVQERCSAYRASGPRAAQPQSRLPSGAAGHLVGWRRELYGAQPEGYCGLPFPAVHLGCCPGTALPTDLTRYVRATLRGPRSPS